MTEQHALWTEPHWTDSWSVGDKVVSRHTNNHGTVVHVEPGRRLTIHWAEWRNEPDGYKCFHSSDSGLVKA